jgi:HKD family nuclease
LTIFLHSPNQNNELSKIYKSAFADATELFVVSAYLTEWDSSLKLNPNCKKFRLIIGKDFGITRKIACEACIKWLTKGRKYQFMVADNISGFHPKAIFWKNSAGKYFSLIGSSNLTRAAFQNNYEANIYSEISSNEYFLAKKWMAISVYVLVAIVKKRLKIEASLYTILQILSLTLFEKTPLDQLLKNMEMQMD